MWITAFNRLQYLDRVAVYRRSEPHPPYARVSPRIWLVLAWVSQIEAQRYAGVAEVIWAYDLAPGEEPPLHAWANAGGAGMWVRGLSADDMAALRERTDIWVWE